MIERFSDSARVVVAESSEYAKRFRHRTTGTQHLVLALVGQKDELGGQVLADLGVTLALARESVRSFPTTAAPAVQGSSRPVPFTVEMETVLRRSDRESRARQDHYVGTGHILLALSKEELSVGHKVLLSLGVEFECLKDKVVMALAEASEAVVAWPALEQRSQEFPLLSAEEERQLAAAVTAGCAARDALNAQDPELHCEREPELRDAIDRGIEAGARLAESNFRLAVCIAKDYADKGHGLVYTFQLAKKALMLSVWLHWDFDPQKSGSFSDYARRHMITMIEGTPDL